MFRAQIEGRSRLRKTRIRIDEQSRGESRSALPHISDTTLTLSRLDLEPEVFRHCRMRCDELKLQDGELERNVRIYPGAPISAGGDRRCFMLGWQWVRIGLLRKF